MAANMKSIEDCLIEAQDRAQELFTAVVANGLIQPGKLESELSSDIHELARSQFGVSRHWHKRIARAGRNTMLAYYDEPPDRRIAEDDIVYLDLGPVFTEWEADSGELMRWVPILSSINWSMIWRWHLNGARISFATGRM